MSNATAPSLVKASLAVGQCLFVSAALVAATITPAQALAANGNDDLAEATDLEVVEDAAEEVLDDSLQLMPMARPAYGMSLMEGPAAAPAPAPAPMVAPPTGVGLIVGGSLLAGLIGLPFTIWGVSGMVAFSACKDVDDAAGGSISPACKATRNVALGVLITGILGLGGGGAMIGFGAKRNVEYRRWKAENGIVLTPTYGVTANNTGVYGLQMQF